MKKYLVLFSVLLICSQQALAQKASDVLENGNPVEKGHRIFLKYDFNDKVLKIDAKKTDQDVNFRTLKDSLIFLIHEDAINVYLRPLNPLNYSYKTESIVKFDPINEAAASVLGEIFNLLNVVAMSILKEERFDIDTCPAYKKLQDQFNKIQLRLSKSKEDEVKKIFTALKSLSFENKQNTIDSINEINDSIKVLENHFKDIDLLLKKSKDLYKKYDCRFPEYYPDIITAKLMFDAILKELSTAAEEQKKRLKNLQTAYKLVEGMRDRALHGGGTDQVKWSIPLNEVSSEKGKISIYTVTINESGYKLSDNDEIVSIESKELTKGSVKFRRFQRFVPEVSVGTVFAFFEYNSYGTTSEANGQQYVGSPTENKINNFKISSMLNFNYFIPNSPIHPFWQLGVGVNSEIPTLLTGIGLRSNIAGIRRFTISGGYAFTWIKELDNLKVGDKVSGTSDIDKDLKYQFATPKPYLGIQYNF